MVRLGRTGQYGDQARENDLFALCLPSADGTEEVVFVEATPCGNARAAFRDGLITILSLRLRTLAEGKEDAVLLLLLVCGFR
jgi:hypothetical protein